MEEIINVTFEEVRESFNRYGLEYNVKSLQFLIKNKKSLAEVARTGDPEATVYLLASGTKTKTLDEAFDIIEAMRLEQVPLEIVHMLCVSQGRDDGFFMNQRGLEVLEGMSKDKDLMSNQEVMQTILGVMGEYSTNLSVLDSLR